MFIILEEIIDRQIIYFLGLLKESLYFSILRIWRGGVLFSVNYVFQPGMHNLNLTMATLRTNPKRGMLIYLFIYLVIKVKESLWKYSRLRKTKLTGHLNAISDSRLNSVPEGKILKWILLKSVD